LLKTRLLVDENIPRTAITTLREKRYDIASVWELRPGMSDEEVVELVTKESRIIITFDKDFGRIALFKPSVPGIILLRIPTLNPLYIVERIEDPYNKLIIVRKRTIKIIMLR